MEATELALTYGALKIKPDYENSTAADAMPV